MFLKLCFLFFIGSVLGWVIEFFFRRFISSANPKRKWLNPGFCTGPYLPLYGFGLCALYLIASLEKLEIIKSTVVSKIFILIIIAVCMTVIECIAGLLSVKLFKLRLWDYSNEFGNIQGIICPKFSFFWAVLGAVYYFFIHHYIMNAVMWLSENLAFSFVIGLFFGVFIIDVAHSIRLVSKLKKFADENEVIVKYENIKSSIQNRYEKTAEKYHFFRPFKTDRPINEHLKEMLDSFESYIKKSKRHRT